VQLFHRTTRSVRLTETGEAYHERCLAVIEQFDELEALVQQRHAALAARIRLTTSTGFGTMHLPPMLARFQEAHPEVVIELQLSDHNIPLIEEGFDLAPRFGELRDSTLVARKLTDMRMICCASPAYLARHGRPQAPQAISAHNCLLLSLGSTPDMWRFQRGAETFAVNVSGRFRTNSPPTVVRMALDGLGVCHVLAYMVKAHLQTGALVQLFPAYERPPIGFYAVYPPSRHLTARIQALIDHLAETVWLSPICSRRVHDLDNCESMKRDIGLHDPTICPFRKPAMSLTSQSTLGRHAFSRPRGSGAAAAAAPAGLAQVSPGETCSCVKAFWRL
jgi:DNA-binding transcriptional LysR family regulator